MAKKLSFGEELEHIRQYLISSSNEDAKRKLAYPLFAKLFGDKFRTESDAQGADGYVEGKFVLELKSKSQDWLAGFYQALHYAKKGLSYPAVIVLCEGFIAVWKLDKIPEFAVIKAHQSLPLLAPNEVGKDLARLTTKASAQEILDSAIFKLDSKEIAQAQKNLQLTYETFNFLQVLNNLDSSRISINPTNFILMIELMKKYFASPIDAVHAFYTIIGYWDITSTISEQEYQEEIRIIGYKGKKMSEPISILPKFKKEFIRFVENRYIFTNEGSGLTVDYYFSRFDEVLAQIDPEYVKQHGIFFTDDNLSKLALWFVNEYFSQDLGINYIVFDPAGGSGNLVSSYRGRLKHKIVSELNPDLLRIIERRMRYDPYHIDTGFTIIPKTSENKGLNFLDKSGKDYLDIIITYLEQKQIKLDKPLAFLLNPPYKNTDENTKQREKADAEYQIHHAILELTGDDAGKERYLAFLGQILNICSYQKQLFPDVNPFLMVFTPTSWLIPRPTFQQFRATFDQHFVFQNGFVTTSNEFFKLDGRWPVAFTIWKYQPVSTENNKRENKIKLFDLTTLTHTQLAQINWADTEQTDFICKQLFQKSKIITLNNSKGDIRETLPALEKNGKMVQQPRLNLYRNRSKEELNKTIISGFPLKDERHIQVKAPHGDVNGTYIGFMDDNTPVRIKQEPSNRLSNKPDKVWFRLDTSLVNLNATKIFSGPADNRSYCAYDLASAKVTFSWFAITKALNGRYPLWANQYDLWSPSPLTPEGGINPLWSYYESLCYAFALAENRCVVTKFEADNPVLGAAEVFVDNPLCPLNQEAFWATVLDNEITKDVYTFTSIEGFEKEPNLALALVNAVKGLYRYWNREYCRGQWLHNIGLQEEAYFRYFDYDDFLTPHSGLIQIRKFAELNAENDLLAYFTQINALSKAVKDEIFRLLVEEFKYFE